MTQPTPSPEPVVIGSAVVGLINAVLALLVVFSIHLPVGLGDALAGVVGALVVAVPLVVAFVVRSKVSPVPAVFVPGPTVVEPVNPVQ